MYEIRMGTKTQRHHHLAQAMAEIKLEYPACHIEEENGKGYRYVWPSREAFDQRTDALEGSVCQIVHI